MSSAPTRATVAAFADEGRPGCRPASPIATTSVGPEVRGTSKTASLYGLIMTTMSPPIRTGEQVKVVWRMTGAGPLQLSAISPGGKRVALLFGPQLHISSDYDRPGQEWGSGYEFATSGCWHLHAARDDAKADVWLRVAAK
jgi:hypothetical protein